MKAAVSLACFFLFASIQQMPAQPPATLQQYVGMYQEAGERPDVTAVYLENGHLYEETKSLARYPLMPDASVSDSFKIGANPVHFVFSRGASGSVEGFKITLDEGGRVLATASRISTDVRRLNDFLDYTRTEAMIPMRDGVKLHTVILRPVKDLGPLPFLMQRTPYGVNGYDANSPNNEKGLLARSGYIFVYQDIRGRYGSEGQFVMNRPIVAHTAKTDVDETTDTRDTVQWLLANVPGNSGKVGVLGVSYPGFLAMMAGIDADPAVKAVSPQAPMTDVWMGDDFFHNGGLPPDLRLRLRAAARSAEDRRPRAIEGRHLRLLPAQRQLRRSRKDCRHAESSHRLEVLERAQLHPLLARNGRRIPPRQRAHSGA